jgi:pimeloyl-ACP methyl ester carboxylesterase
VATDAPPPSATGGAAEPVVVLGGFLTWPALYRDMCRAMRSLGNAPVEIVDVVTWDWLAAISARGWARILDRLHEVVTRLAAESPTGRVVLVGHSAGGVMGRLYLSDQPFLGSTYAGLERVSTLITLGSPHHNPRSAVMRRYVEQHLPGAFYAPRVRYVSVAGRAMRGTHGGASSRRLAGWFYEHLAEDADSWGDGMVPVEVALLDGAERVVLDGVHHAAVFGTPWYGSPGTVKRWCC